LQTGFDKPIAKIWNEIDLEHKHHIGLSVYDLQKMKPVFEYNADNFFTPASNIKILTMYASLKILGDQLDAAWYIERGDSLFVWGGGDPGSYYPDNLIAGSLPDFIKASDKTIVFSDDHFMTTRFGKGWMWDDYPHPYQCERNAYPVYGNRVWLKRTEDTTSITPKYLASLVSINRDIESDAGKSEWGDSYYYKYDPELKSEEVEIPITFFRNDVLKIWSEATGKDIVFSNEPISANAKRIKGSVRDSMIGLMMLESDNFVAEQLLLSCAMESLGYMNEEDLIETLLRGPLSDMVDPVRWVDGSGLSRYNQVTPRSMISILMHLFEMKDLGYLQKIFPAGGLTGTLKSDFAGTTGVPYIYAKSGSLRNTYCLSGFLITKSGNILLFSWMNNGITGKTADLKVAMEKLFSVLYDQY
jgi:D-alanyl-D-alanine carboxypeptidase/D-alanyl-D-alanine-endopeptidase (penicillin-binding protein 4)